MIANHEMVERPATYYGKKQKRVVSLRSPELDRFKPDDIAFVDGIIQQMWGASATQVSEFSHGIAWRVAGSRTLIPYESVFLSNEEVTEFDQIRTEELADQYGWERA